MKAGLIGLVAFVVVGIGVEAAGEAPSQSTSAIPEPRTGALEFEGKFRFELQPDGDSIEAAWDLHYWWAAPKEWATQRIVRIDSLDPEPDSQYIDAQNGNVVYFWDFSKHPQPAFETTFSWRALEVDQEINPQRITSFDPDDEILEGYLKSDGLITLTPGIQTLAAALSRGKKNVYDKARAIFDWVVDNMEYTDVEMTPELRRQYQRSRGEERSGDTGRDFAGWAMRRLELQFSTRDECGTGSLLTHSPQDPSSRLYRGNSVRYSFMFCALCRAAGIPARPVFGFLTGKGDESPHAWAEFYAPPYAWIPADPACSDPGGRFGHQPGLPAASEDYFGKTDPYRVILSKGSCVELRPGSPAENAGALIVDGRAGYLQLGVWNIEKIPAFEYEFTVSPKEAAK